MRTARVLIRGIVVVAAIALSTRGTDACVRVVPTAVPPAGLAPTNTHVWIYGLQLPLYAGASFVLVASGESSRPVPAKLRTWESSMLWELVPIGGLRPHTRYEVWGIPRARPSKGTSQGSNRAPPPLLLGAFRTTADADTSPPAAPTLKDALQSHPLALLLDIESN